MLVQHKQQHENYYISNVSLTLFFRKFKNSNGWQKLWVVFTNFCLYFYKTFQGTNQHHHEAAPSLSLSLSFLLQNKQMNKSEQDLCNSCRQSSPIAIALMFYRFIFITIFIIFTTTIIISFVTTTIIITMLQTTSPWPACPSLVIA